jgi:hypothetical protein
MLASSTAPPAGDEHLKGTAMHKFHSAIGVLAVAFALIAPIAVHAEIISVPSATPSDPAASLPPPTVLRGSPPTTAKAAPICPPGYTLSPGYGCIAPSGDAYTEASPDYSYWPDYGWGYPFVGFPAFGAGAGRFHHVARSHGFRGLPGRADFHGRAGFHGPAGSQIAATAAEDA